MAPLYLGARDISGPGAGKRAPMNCLLEAAASLWLGARRRVMTEPPEEEVVTAQEGLEQCRRNMEARERELLGLVDRLTEEALAKRRAGDALAAVADTDEKC
jgi:hypothetical protein